MESFELILVILACVLASSVFDTVLSRVSMPLVQIAIGVVVGIFINEDPTAIFSNPELFLLIFIAPLLFDESRHADKAGLWRNKGAVVSLAVGLVFLTVLVVGYVLNFFVPSIPLAAAFALGAALGPTDAVAVAALGKDVTLSKRQKSLLSGEALINDASGVVSFEFAIAAAVTGAFSLADASASFLVDFFGGLICGVVFAAIIMFILGRMRSLGLDTPTVYVLFEVCMPFLTYITAEHLEVSGILAVVAAGLFMKFYPSSLTLESSRYAVASENVWELLSFALNGVIFVLLGMKLPEVIMPTWNAAADGVGAAAGIWLVALVALITVLVLGVRYIWVLVLEMMVRDAETGERRGFTPEVARSAAVVTLAGPKGAVTLSIVLSLPYLTAAGTAFPNRDLLIFLASGVIICTLLLANFVVPILAPAQEKDEDDENARSKVEIEILQNVINELLANQTPETAVATRVAVGAYRDRMNLVREREVSDETLRDLRLDVLDEQLEYVKDRMADGSVSRYVGEKYASSLSHMIAVLKVRKGAKPATAQAAIAAGIPGVATATMSPVAAVGRADLRKKAPFTWALRYVLDKVRGSRMSEGNHKEMSHLVVDVEEFALRYLEHLPEDMTLEERHAAALLRSEYSANLMAMKLRIARAEAEAAEEAGEQPQAAAPVEAPLPNDASEVDGKTLLASVEADTAASEEALRSLDDTVDFAARARQNAARHRSPDAGITVSAEVAPVAAAHALMPSATVALQPDELLAVVEKRNEQLEKVVSTPLPQGTGMMPPAAANNDDAGVVDKVNQAAAVAVDAAATVSAALVGENTHTGRGVKGTFLGARRVKAKTRDIEAEALALELEQIQLMREAGRLSNADARELREEVYMLQMGLEAR